MQMHKIHAMCVYSMQLLFSSLIHYQGILIFLEFQIKIINNPGSLRD